MKIAQGLQVPMVRDEMGDLVSMTQKHQKKITLHLKCLRTFTQWFSLNPGRLKGCLNHSEARLNEVLTHNGIWQCKHRPGEPLDAR